MDRDASDGWNSNDFLLWSLFYLFDFPRCVFNFSILCFFSLFWRFFSSWWFLSLFWIFRLYPLCGLAFWRGLLDFWLFLFLILNLSLISNFINLLFMVLFWYLFRGRFLILLSCFGIFFRFLYFFFIVFITIFSFWRSILSWFLLLFFTFLVFLNLLWGFWVIIISFQRIWDIFAFLFSHISGCCEFNWWTVDGL